LKLWPRIRIFFNTLAIETFFNNLAQGWSHVPVWAFWYSVPGTLKDREKVLGSNWLMSKWKKPYQPSATNLNLRVLVRSGMLLCFKKKRTISNHVLRLEFNPFQQREESFYLRIVMALA
jgi:hypothetical protein